MVFRNITERRRSYSFIRAAKIVCVCFLLAAFCGAGNTGYAQVKRNNTPPVPNRSAANNQTAQNRSAAQNRASVQQRQNAQNAQSTQRGSPRTLPQGNRNDQLLEATNSTAAMNAARQAIPWDRLSNPAKNKIQSVLSSKPLYRRLPQQSAYCEPIMYDFLLNHPDVVVAIWEHLGVTQISLKEQGRPGVYQLRETVGSTGTIEVLYKTRNYCIAYSKGAYIAPFLPKPVEGETVLILQSVFEQDEEGEPYVVTQLDAFVKVNNFGVDMFAKMFASPLGRIADSNFEQTIAFLGNVSEAAQANPEVIRRLSLRLESIRKDVREEFVRVAYQTAQLAINRSDDGLNSPYGRHLADRQAAQANQQRQEFERERMMHLQNLQRSQQEQRQQNLQRGSLSSALGLRQESVEPGTRPNTPAAKAPPGPLVKPTNTFTFEEMSPENDFSRGLEFVERATSTQSTPSQSKPAPIVARNTPRPAPSTTTLNLDLSLDLNFDLDKPASSPATSSMENNKVESPKSEPSAPILDLDLGGSNLPASNRNTFPATTPKLATIGAPQVSPSRAPQPAEAPQLEAPQKEAVSNEPIQASTSTGKTGAVFSKPAIAR